MNKKGGSMEERKTVLVLRTCDKDGKSYNGFQWPKKGRVVAPDWKANYECGNGLHGLLWGEGDGSLLNWDEDARWLVVRVAIADLMHGKGDMTGKCKFRAGTVVHCGDRFSATEYMREHGLSDKAIVGGTATAGYRGTATAGDRGTATAGDRGTATAGVGGTATAGYGGTATAGYGGTATAGVGGTATAGVGGTATAGDGGTATAGDRGTATAGDRGTATAGVGGTATAGYGGSIIIRYWDSKKEMFRVACSAVGDNGIKANVAYRVNEEGVLQEVAK